MNTAIGFLTGAIICAPFWWFIGREQGRRMKREDLHGMVEQGRADYELIEMQAGRYAMTDWSRN